MKGSPPAPTAMDATTGGTLPLSKREWHGVPREYDKQPGCYHTLLICSHSPAASGTPSRAEGELGSRAEGELGSQAEGEFFRFLRGSGTECRGSMTIIKFFTHSPGLQSIDMGNEQTTPFPITENEVAWQWFVTRGASEKLVGDAHLYHGVGTEP